MGALFNILSYSISSLFFGVIIAVLIVVLMLVGVSSWHSDKTLTPLSFVIVGLLGFFLIYQSVLLLGAIKMKSYCTDIEETVCSVIPDGTRLSEGDGARISGYIGEQWPMLGRYVESIGVSGGTPAEMAHSVADELRSRMNRFIVRRVMWSLPAILVGLFGIVKTMEVVRRSRHRGYHSRRKIYED